MNDDFFALVDTDALKVLSGQPSASAAAMLLVDTHGLIRAQTAAAGELLDLENGDLLASALSDEAVALVEDCASGGGASSMTEHLDVGDCRLTVVPHPDGALVALEPQPLRLPRDFRIVTQLLLQMAAQRVLRHRLQQAREGGRPHLRILIDKIQKFPIFMHAHRLPFPDTF